jgi:hypothetical protein
MVGTLEKIAAQVHAAIAPFLRPTLCGFGRDLSLDYAYTLGGTWHHNNHSFTTTIQNFSPNACDFAVYYPYGYNSRSSDPNLINWDVTDLLTRSAANDGLIALTQQQGVSRVPGWDPSTLLWGAVPQAFGSNPWTGTNRYVTPTATDMVTMDNAYCTTGAAFLLDFTYDDGEGASRNEPFNDSVLAQGQINGHVQCRNYFISATTNPTATATPGTSRRSRSPNAAGGRT